MKTDCDYLALIYLQGRETCKTAIRIFLFVCVSKVPQGECPHYILQEDDFRAVTGLCFLVWKCLDCEHPGHGTFWTSPRARAHVAPSAHNGSWLESGPLGVGGAGLCSKSLSLHEAPWTADRFKAKHHGPIRVLGPGVGVTITNVLHSLIHPFVCLPQASAVLSALWPWGV